MTPPGGKRCKSLVLPGIAGNLRCFFKTRSKNLGKLGNNSACKSTVTGPYHWGREDGEEVPLFCNVSDHNPNKTGLCNSAFSQALAEGLHADKRRLRIVIWQIVGAHRRYRCGLAGCLELTLAITTSSAFKTENNFDPNDCDCVVGAWSFNLVCRKTSHTNFYTRKNSRRPGLFLSR